MLHDNAAACALYERLGFVVEGRRIHDWKHERVYRDSILMAVNIVTTEFCLLPPTAHRPPPPAGTLSQYAEMHEGENVTISPTTLSQLATS